MILWIASYPKSGNTILRSMLSAYFFSEDGSFNFKLLKNIRQFPKKIFFKNLGINLKDQDEVVKNFINAQKIINKDKNIQFWKTHSGFFKFNNKYSFTNHHNTIGVIYIVRDPRNLTGSISNHFDISLEEATNMMCENRFLIEDENDIPVYIGSWSSNYNSWKALQGKNYFLIKYEDLIANKENYFIELLKFIKNLTNLNFEIDYTKIKKVVETTEFNKMKISESINGFAESKIGKKGNKINFFNLGKDNKYQNYLGKLLIDKIEKNFELEMKELNYL